MIKNPFKYIYWRICEKLNLCGFCLRRKAVWSYAPGLEYACDECVPRGCSCNMEPKDDDYNNDAPDNWVERVDAKGRKYPCCEWMWLFDE